MCDHYWNGHLISIDNNNKLHWVALTSNKLKIMYKFQTTYIAIQWSLSIVDTIGTGQSILIIEMTSGRFVHYKTTLPGTPESVLIIECPD